MLYEELCPKVVKLLFAINAVYFKTCMNLKSYKSVSICLYQFSS